MQKWMKTFENTLRREPSVRLVLKICSVIGVFSSIFVIVYDGFLLGENVGVYLFIGILGLGGSAFVLWMIKAAEKPQGKEP